ncbi:MAG: hypothetical protein ACRDLB_11785 [Actinomycetota bacterium]
MTEQQISWMALEEGTPVHSSEGEELGKVTTIVADRSNDIFSGIAFRHGLLGSDHFVPAADVSAITSRSVHLALSSNEAKELEPYET